MKAFSHFHPMVLLIYFISVFAVSMFMQNPIYLVLCLIGSLMFLSTLKSTSHSLISLIKYLPLFIIITAINPLFSHSGATPLFFINDNAVTLEAIIYGSVMALMIICVIFWFKSFNIIFDSEKILFLFGKLSPKISLIFSMALHFIPNFFKYFQEVLSVQKHIKHKSKVKLYIACFSSVITHSLENAVETADSMSARGYGTGKATAFSRFKFKTSDLMLLLLIIALDVLTFLAIALGNTEFLFYPEIVYSEFSLIGILSYFAFGTLCVLPSVYEIKEVVKWKYSILRT